MIVYIFLNDICGMYFDMYELWIDFKNFDCLLFGNDGGFYVFWDEGINWLYYNNLLIVEFYVVFVDNDEFYNIYGGIQDCVVLVGFGIYDVND